MKKYTAALVAMLGITVLAILIPVGSASAAEPLYGPTVQATVTAFLNVGDFSAQAFINLLISLFGG